MSASPVMEDVNTLVLTMRGTLAAPVTLAMNWTAMDSTALVSIDKVVCLIPSPVVE